MPADFDELGLGCLFDHSRTGRRITLEHKTEGERTKFAVTPSGLVYDLNETTIDEVLSLGGSDDLITVLALDEDDALAIATRRGLI